MNGELILNYEKENKLAIASLHDKNYEELADITAWKNKYKYCEKNGYNFHVKTEDFKLGYGFEKINFILQLFERYNYEWIYWCGCDTMIMNFTKKLEDFIDNNYHFIISKDCHDINADSFFIRNSKEGIEYFKFILSQHDKYKGDCWQEQRVMIHNENVEPWRSYTKIVPQYEINSYLYENYGRRHSHEQGQFVSGDFLLHLPGMNLEQRLRICSEKIKEVIND